MWDGKTWNITNNRLFQARFEKYLNAPEATTAEDKLYQATISEILNRLAPASAHQQNIDMSFRLLPRGASFDQDARLCDSLANAVYTVWMAQRQQQRLLAVNEAMQYDVKRLEAATRGQVRAAQNAKDANEKMKGKRQGAAGAVPGGGTPVEQAAEAKQTVIDQGSWQTRELAQLIAWQQANLVKREVSELAAKLEFQALMVQFFMQRRYQHVIMATRFYRALFNDGDSKLTVGKDIGELFQRSSGQPPTVTILDTLANEAIRDVREGVRAFEFLVEKSELDSATKRLGEAFLVGEHMPEIRTLSREKKRKVVEFAHKSFQLQSALDVKDYTLAESIVKDLATSAKDFDSSKPTAAVETARQLAHFQISIARNASISGDRTAFETAFKAATELWPRNPELTEVSRQIFTQGDVQQKAIVDFDQLLSQKNHRQIYNDSGRFIAALATYPERQTQLKAVLEDMKTIEVALLRAEEMARQSNYAGAWESVEKAFAKFPNDSLLNQQRATLTTQAADFVRAIRRAQDLEKQEQVGSSLAWYLKAQKQYPQSDFATEAIGRLVKRVLPEG